MSFSISATSLTTTHFDLTNICELGIFHGEVILQWYTRLSLLLTHTHAHLVLSISSGLSVYKANQGPTLLDQSIRSWRCLFSKPRFSRAHFIDDISLDNCSVQSWLSCSLDLNSQAIWCRGTWYFIWYHRKLVPCTIPMVMVHHRGSFHREHYVGIWIADEYGQT